ncbi:tRNA/rRNA methyltransferase, SpoU [Ostreococcus tauri]|uniref:tRNA/rRNA methyltransferase, SpoU n=1 Tax=Ostreococcus tauri TaxID=70448 RepID=A0A090LYA8_OSTTA|nr:tRNA/rRNA methyltransferase, SpoU [Ostreococcus tauri]CEF96880.1 tRNA/rRNA methyltransferase, SpoU [Ostreococcus tauri]|eukprot:XP_022838354.1 tRNA/rRNA methyltransferase, SpoU [Ostreococcus tauri]
MRAVDAVARRGAPARPRARLNPSSARNGAESTTRRSLTSNDPRWVEDVREQRPELENVRFVLCAPQGAANVGACARAMQNFGVYELKLCEVGPNVLERDDAGETAATRGTESDAERILDEASEGEGKTPERAANQTLPLSAEALRYACAADWMLEDAERCADVEAALAGCTFVLATTARPRTGTPLMTAREAAKKVAEEAKRGKVAVLFGNERTGLTNEELAWASAAVVVPTAGAGKLCRKSLKYTGATGPTSLNLSHAVGIIAYEIFMACSGDDASSSPEASSTSSEPQKLLTAEEKITLRNELVAARRALDVLDADVDRASPSKTSNEDEDEDVLRKREAKAFERVLAAAPVHRSDAAALFQLSRRVSAIRRGSAVANGVGEGILDATIVESIRELVVERGADAPAPTVRNCRNHIRERLGVSLTNREIERARARATATSTSTDI